jgi:hypothetical protein
MTHAEARLIPPAILAAMENAAMWKTRGNLQLAQHWQGRAAALTRGSNAARKREPLAEGHKRSARHEAAIERFEAMKVSVLAAISGEMTTADVARATGLPVDYASDVLNALWNGGRVTKGYRKRVIIWTLGDADGIAE